VNTVRLRSLLLSQQPHTVALVTRVCRELSLELQHCSTAESALEKLAARKFHGVIVDDQVGASAAQVLNAQAEGKKSLNIALAKQEAGLDAVFSAGTHLVIYKPITHDRLRNGLSAIRNLMGRDQREAPRVSANIPATLTVDETKDIPAKVLDISTGGVALSIQGALPPSKSLKLSFVLPGAKNSIAAAVELAWKDVHGRFGVQFLKINPAFASDISKWVKQSISGR